MYKTFQEYERIAYMSNLPKIAALYAQLDDNEQFDYDIEDLKGEVRSLEQDLEDEESRADRTELIIEKLEKKLEKIAEIINE
jgi:hypothetical protein